MEIWQRIRHLAAQNHSARDIAVEVGVSRNTVRAVLSSQDWDGYSRARSAGQVLEPYREVVEAGLRRNLRGCRLLRLVREAGYQGSRATFYRWLQEVKKAAKPRPATCRFETDPGEQAQFDWSPYTVTLGGQPTNVFVYSLLLGYSRRIHWFPSLAEDMGAIFEGLVAGFVHFGGGCRFLLVDNPKTFVIRHRGSDLVWNDNFQRLCGHFRIQPIAGTPRHPQGKGKVENPFASLETWVITGNEWRDFAHFQEEIAAFEGDWEQRIHGTTKIPPGERFEEERPLLIPLPKDPWSVLTGEFRQVSNDCLISYGGVRYSVPWEHASEKVRVRVSQGRFVVACDEAGVEVARHLKQRSGAPPVICAAHYEGLRRREQAALATLIGRYRDRYAAASQTAERFLKELLAHHPHHPERIVGNVLELLSGAPDTLALAVLADAVEFGIYRTDYLTELLRRRLSSEQQSNQRQPAPAPPPTQLALPELSVERSLTTYGRALKKIKHNQP